MTLPAPGEAPVLVVVVQRRARLCGDTHRLERTRSRHAGRSSISSADKPIRQCTFARFVRPRWTAGFTMPVPRRDLDAGECREYSPATAAACVAQRGGAIAGGRSGVHRRGLREHGAGGVEGRYGDQTRPAQNDDGRLEARAGPRANRRERFRGIAAEDDPRRHLRRPIPGGVALPPPAPLCSAATAGRSAGRPCQAN